MRKGERRRARKKRGMEGGRKSKEGEKGWKGRKGEEGREREMDAFMKGRDGRTEVLDKDLQLHFTFNSRIFTFDAGRQLKTRWRRKC